MKPATDHPTALTCLYRIISDSDRKSVLRREILDLGYSDGQVDHALATARKQGLITRVGQGIYAVGDARISEVMPEALPKLGYRVLPKPPLSNYSIRRSGVTYRLDRPCHRFVMRNGVVATFETPQGRLSEVRTGKKRTMRKELPTTQEVDRHFRQFQYCHSLARAEKDMIVNRVLDVYDEHTDPIATFAIEGGTSLAKYQRSILRFSEDLDIRVVPNTPRWERDHMREVGERLQERFFQEIPFLLPTNKGRLRRDGVIHTLIFDYSGSVTHEEVQQGIKIEFTALPVRCPLLQVSRKQRDRLVIHPLETIAGKFSALVRTLPAYGDSNPDLVRHVHDIADSVAVIGTNADQLSTLVEEIADEVPSVVRELCRPCWQNHYQSYMRRMGSLPTYEHEFENPPYTHVSWVSVLSEFALVCRSLNLIDSGHINEVHTTVERLKQSD